MADWKPQVGDWVVYCPGHGPREDGEVTSIRSQGMVMVLYRGDRYAKATYVRDLVPGNPLTAGGEDRG